jgi:hypothetical protein
MIGEAQRAKRELGLCEEGACPKPATIIATPMIAEGFRFATRYCNRHAGPRAEPGWHFAALKPAAR